MVLILCVLLQQAPVLVPGETRELPEKAWRALAVSRTGKYLVLGESDRLRILDANSLVPVKELVLRWTAFGFDGEDEHLLVVGSDVVRFAVLDWSLQVQVPLPGTEFADQKVGQLPAPGKAVVLQNQDFYYCTIDGGLSLGSVVEQKLSVKPLSVKSDYWITRILGMVENLPVLALERGVRPGIISRDRVHPLAGCHGPLVASEAGTFAVVIGLEEDILYNRRTWKAVAARSGEKNGCAVVDAASGWVFVGGESGLRAWRATQFQDQVRLDAFKGGVLQLAVDGRQRTLFSVEKTALRRWTIRD